MKKLFALLWPKRGESGHGKQARKIVSIAVCAAMLASLSSALFVSSAADDPSDIVFSPSDISPTDASSPEHPYLVKESGTQAGVGYSNQGFRFADNTGYMIYKVPVDKSAGSAKLVLTLSNNYIVSLSPTGADGTWVTAAFRAQPFDHSAFDADYRTNVVIDLANYLHDNKKSAGDTFNVYFKIGDYSTGDGWGGKFWRAELTYSNDVPGRTSEVDVTPTDDAQFLVADHDSAVNGNHERFVDGTSYLIYKIPLNVSATDEQVDFKVVQDYVIWESATGDPNGAWTKVAFGANGANTPPTEETIDLKDAVAAAKADGKVTGENAYAYLKITDGTTDNGMGGVVNSFKILTDIPEQPASDSPKDEAFIPYDATSAGYFIDQTMANTEQKYLVTDSGSKTQRFANSLVERYCDNGSYAVYRMPLDKTATDAKLVLTLSGNYVVSLSPTGTDGSWLTAAIKDQPFDNDKSGIKSTVTLDLMPYVLDAVGGTGQPYIYFKIADYSTNDGWGGAVWAADLTYSGAMSGMDDFSFTPGDPLTESRYLFKQIHDSTNDNAINDSHQRFLDGDNAAIYKIPLDLGAKEVLLRAEVSSDYVLWISTDTTTGQDGTWTKISAAPDGKDTVNGNVEYELADIIKQVKEAGGVSGSSYVYFKISDQTTDGGNGGCLSRLSLIHEDEPDSSSEISSDPTDSNSSGSSSPADDSDVYITTSDDGNNDNGNTMDTGSEAVNDSGYAGNVDTGSAGSGLPALMVLAAAAVSVGVLTMLKKK